MPAGTGVCVVKTLLDRQASKASSKVSLYSLMNRRMRSMARNAEWPSFMCHTVGFRLSRSSARRPPMPKHDFLPDAREIVAAIKLRGDLAILGALVFRNVGVQQIELHASDVDVPDLDENHAGRQLDGDHHVFAIFVPHRPHRKRVEIVDRVAFLLPAIRIERLLQVAFLVQQADANQRNRAVAGSFQVVAGKHAQVRRHKSACIPPARTPSKNTRSADRPPGSGRSR